MPLNISKKVVLYFLLFLTLNSAYSQDIAINPVVDERTELLCVVFRLAGLQEYNNNKISIYTNEVDSCFAPYKNHEVVKLAKRLNKVRGVSYNAVVSMALYIEINDKIEINPLVSEDNLDKRWGKDNAIRFVKYLNDFYEQTKFREFYCKHKEFYDIATNNYQSVIDSIDTQWFSNFFGEETRGDFKLILTFTNFGCYGPHLEYKDGRKDIYAIMSGWFTDSLGFPVYTKHEIPILVHEFCHSFSNPMVDKNYHLFEKKVTQMYKPVSKLMKQQAYGTPKSMIYEIVVRASVIKYFEHKKVEDFKVRSLIVNEQVKGFLWIDELVTLLDEYLLQRSSYHSINEFLPRIAELHNSLNPYELKQKIESKKPSIVSCNIQHKSKKVNPSTSEIVVYFSQPMRVGTNGASYGKKGKEFFPVVPKDKETKWDTEKGVWWSIPVALEPNTQYSLSFPAHFFTSEDFYPLLQTFYLDFKTSK